MDATVIAHSPTIAAALVDHLTAEILLLGGPIYEHSAVACGAATVEAARRQRRPFLLGVTGVHPEHGLTTGDPEEAAMKRALAGHAADTYALASAEKIGAVSAYKVLDIDDVTGIVTDGPADSDTFQTPPPRPSGHTEPLTDFCFTGGRRFGPASPG